MYRSLQRTHGSTQNWKMSPKGNRAICDGKRSSDWMSFFFTDEDCKLVSSSRAPLQTRGVWIRRGFDRNQMGWDFLLGMTLNAFFFGLGNKKGWFPILCVPLFLLVFFVGLLSKPLLEPFTAFMVLSHFSCCSAFSFLSSCQSQVHSWRI